MLQNCTSVTKMKKKFFPVPCTAYNDLNNHISSEGIGLTTLIHHNLFNRFKTLAPRQDFSSMHLLRCTCVTSMKIFIKIAQTSGKLFNIK